MVKRSNWVRVSSDKWLREDGATVSRGKHTDWQAGLSEAQAATVLDVTGVEEGGGHIHWFKGAAAAKSWIDAHHPLPGVTSKSGSSRPAAEPIAPLPDPVGDFLTAKGYVGNNFLLDLNRGLQTPRSSDLPYPWNLPSRLFEFPIEISRQYPDGTRKCGMLSPLLKAHPFVQVVAHDLSTQGIALEENGVADDCQYTKGHIGEWWHAVDLLSAGRVDDLLATREFTTDEHIARAVILTLLSGECALKRARQILSAVGLDAPADKLGALFNFHAPSVITDHDGGRPRVPINTPLHGEANDIVWACIAAIEAGYFEMSHAGRFEWSQLGIKCYEAGKTTKLPLGYVDASGQGAFAF